MGPIIQHSFLIVLFVLSVSWAGAGQKGWPFRIQAPASVGCADGGCDMATSGVRSPVHGGLRAFAMYSYHHNYNTTLQRVNLIDYSGKKRDLRKKPEENGWDPKMFSPIGTMTPNQDIVDPDLENWKDKNTSVWIRSTEIKFISTVLMVSPCHAIASYHSVFGGDADPDFSKYSVTINLTNPNSGQPVNMKARPVFSGNLDLKRPEEKEELVLLKTDRCISQESGIGWLEFEEIDESERDVDVHIAAFYGDKGGSQFWTQKNCKLRFYSVAHGWVHDCPSLEQSSGGGVIKILGGVPKLVAVNWGAFSKQSTVVDGSRFEDLSGATSVNHF